MEGGERYCVMDREVALAGISFILFVGIEVEREVLLEVGDVLLLAVCDVDDGWGVIVWLIAWLIALL